MRGFRASLVCVAALGLTSACGARSSAQSLTVGPSYSSPTASPISTAVEGPSLKTLHLAFVRMTGSESGWATEAGYELLSPAVLRTTDGGSHWRDVTPVHAAGTAVAATYFLDINTAWVGIAPNPESTGPKSMAVWRTSDAGRTWTGGNPSPFLGGQLDFVDLQHGWLFGLTGAATGSTGDVIFATSDGGLHWQLVSFTSGTPSESTAGSLPFACDKNGVSS